MVSSMIFTTSGVITLSFVVNSRQAIPSPMSHRDASLLLARGAGARAFDILQRQIALGRYDRRVFSVGADRQAFAAVGDVKALAPGGFEEVRNGPAFFAPACR